MPRMTGDYDNPAARDIKMSGKDINKRPVRFSLHRRGGKANRIMRSAYYFYRIFFRICFYLDNNSHLTSVSSFIAARKRNHLTGYNFFV